MTTTIKISISVKPFRLFILSTYQLALLHGALLFQRFFDFSRIPPPAQLTGIQPAKVPTAKPGNPLRR